MAASQRAHSCGCRGDVLREEREHAVERGLNSVRLVLAHAEGSLALDALREAVEERVADACKGSTSEARRSAGHGKGAAAAQRAPSEPAAHDALQVGGTLRPAKQVQKTQQSQPANQRSPS